MTRRIIDVTQRTDAWRQVRLGKLTGSRADDMLGEAVSAFTGGFWMCVGSERSIGLCVGRRRQC